MFTATESVICTSFQPAGIEEPAESAVKTDQKPAATFESTAL